jgi:cyclase
MRRVRIIPALLIQKGGLVKSVRFKDHLYVGDPINAVKIFNEKEVDEIVVLDISATKDGRKPDMSFVKTFASEAFMPMAYGGGITTLAEIEELISSGVEKAVLNTVAYIKPSLISDAAKYVGSQSIVVSIDVKKNLFGKNTVYVSNGKKNTGVSPQEYARRMADLGAGELILNSIDRDGTFTGYDGELIEKVASSVSVPVVALGGAGSVDDFLTAVARGAAAVSAGSMFVLQRPHRAVLISYPSQQELKEKVFSKI